MQGKSFPQTLHWCIKQDFQATRHCVTCCILIRLSHRMLTVKSITQRYCCLYRKNNYSTYTGKGQYDDSNDNNTLPCTRCFSKQYDSSVLTFNPWMPECLRVCINNHVYTLPLTNVHTCALPHVHTYTYVSNANNSC